MAIAGLLATRAGAQSVLFDFENAAAHTPFPIALSAGGITAQFSGTAQGYSIQQANVLGFAPAGFSGNCVYPSSVFAADLRVSFSVALTGFSILYAPQELACDSSATMRVTAYFKAVLIGSATTNAAAGTWPSETLSFTSAKGFDSVVVHYDKPPVTGGDWGPIFMADNMEVTPAPPPVTLENATLLPNGAFRFEFAHTPGGNFTVLASADPALPIGSWTVLGTASESSPGHSRFTDPQARTRERRFYVVRAP